VINMLLLPIFSQ